MIHFHVNHLNLINIIKPNKSKMDGANLKNQRPRKDSVDLIELNLSVFLNQETLIDKW